MKNKEIYAPLKFAKNFNLGSVKEIITEGAKHFGVPIQINKQALFEEISEMESPKTFKMICDKSFFQSGYKGPYSTLHRFLMECKAMNKAFFEDSNCKDDWMSMIAMSSIVEIWRQHKQVYMFDPEFVSALSKTEKLKLYPSLLRRLPYSSFYFDFSEIKEFYPFDGMFVYVEVHDNDSILILGNRTIGQMYFPCMSVFDVKDQISENGVVCYDYEKAHLTFSKELFISDSHRKYAGFEDETISNGKFPDIWMFLMQALTYLSSKEPDIQENQKQKSIYRPSTTIRDKNSEIRKWDVGVRYGTKIRLSGSEDKKSSNVPDNNENIVIREKGTRKSPRPHSRCAHWAHYWTGPGRKKVELRWIEPVFIGVKTDIPVVKHIVDRQNINKQNQK